MTGTHSVFSAGPSAGAKERHVLRVDRAVQRTRVVKEQSAAWTPLQPSIPQRLISPNNPPWAISVDGAKLKGLAQYLGDRFYETIARGYPLQITDKKVVEAIREVYPVPGLELYEGILVQNNFEQLLSDLNQGLFLRAGSVLQIFPSIQVAFYFEMQKPWESIPYLGGRAQTWQTRMSASRKWGESDAWTSGWAIKNLHAYDPEAARQMAESKYRAFLSEGQTMGIPPDALEKVRRLHDEDPRIFQELFGVEPVKREETHHARDSVWSAYFFEEAEGWSARDPLEAEAVVKPWSFLDRMYWDPAKAKGQWAIAQDLVELSGQTQTAADTLRVLKEKKGDDWAYAYFWFYLFEKMYEMGYQSGTLMGRDQASAGIVWSFLASEGLSNPQSVEAHLKSVSGGGASVGPGARAFELIRRFHDENFLTEDDRIEILEKAEKGQPVSLGGRQPAAGAEETLENRLKGYLKQVEESAAMMQSDEVRFLGAAMSSRLLGQESFGALMVRLDEDQLLDPDHVIVADEEFLPRADLPLIPGGTGIQAVAATARGIRARQGDLLLFKAGPGVTKDRVQQAVDEYLPGRVVRSVIVSGEQYLALSRTAYNELAKRIDLPPVIELLVSVKVQDEQGRWYAFAFMA